MTAKNALRTTKHQCTSVQEVEDYVRAALSEGIATEIRIRDDRSGTTGRIIVLITGPRTT